MKLLWVTNLQAPYREPIWRELSKVVDIRLTFLARSEKNRTWKYRATSSYESAVLRTRSIERGENTYYIARIFDVYRSVKAVDVVVLGGWDSPAYWQYLLCARALGKWTLGFYEGTGLSQRFTSGIVARVRRTFYRSCTGALAVGRGSRTALAAMGVRQEATFVLRNGVDHEFFREAWSGQQAVNDVRFLFVGQLIERKGIDLLLRALSNIDSHVTGYSATIVGSGEQEGELRRLASALAVDDVVEFHEHVDDPSALRAHYSAADVLVLPSRREVYGLVVDEALAAGLSVVVSSQAGVAQEARGLAGVFVCDPTVDSLRHALCDASQYVRKSGLPGPRVRFEWHIQAENLVRFVREVTRVGFGGDGR